MAILYRSNDNQWLDSSNMFYNGLNPDKLSQDLANAVMSIQFAKDCLDKAAGLKSFDYNVTTSDTEIIVDNLRRFVYFCNGIHYEISELVDTPFSIRLGKLTEEIISVDPSEYKCVKSKTLGIKSYTRLPNIIKSSFEDADLKDSFNNLITELDDDEIYYDLQDSINEANWWQEQFEIAEQIDDATDNLFTAEVKKQWDSMSIDEREKYIQKYKEILDEIYFGPESKVPRDVEYLHDYYDEKGNFVGAGYGLSSSFPQNTISINIKFKTSPKGMYSLDKMIDTMTHEMRHRYQNLNMSDMPDVIREEWNRTYISYDKNKNNYMKYYKQPVEKDAKAFAALAHDDNL